MTKKITAIILILSASAALLHAGAAGTVRPITLDEAMARARARSVNASVALDRLRSAYWEYRTYRAELLPEVSFTATTPAYYKQYTPYQNPDGTYSFVRNNYMQINGEISVSQNIWLTGGKLSLNTSLDYLRQLDGDKTNRFMAIPVALTLNQPIFGVNNIKWDRKIEPVRYSEAKAEFLSATEEVAMTAINYYFNLLMARENVAISRQNLDNAVKLHEVAKEKRAMGRISENDLLQMELNVLEARSALTNAESNMKANMFQLRSFLDYGEEEELEPEVPEDVPQIELTYKDALEKAQAYNKFAKNLVRRQLEADYAIAKAKGDLRQIELFAQVGLTGTGNELRHGYEALKANQIVEVGVKIPLIDWGKRRGKVRVAESNRRVVENRLRQETQDFNQDLFILVERFNNQQQQLDIARRADSIARRRYSTNVETFLIGKISTLDLNDSQVKKDEARQQLINELYLFWNYYYQLRSLTLWNYATGTGIDADIEKILKELI